MAFATNRALARRLTGYQRTRPVAVRTAEQAYGTNRVEQALILGTIALVPLQSMISLIPGFSVMWLMFAAQAGYVLIKRRDCLTRVWNHPLLLSVYVFLCIGYVVEGFHPFSDYGEI